MPDDSKLVACYNRGCGQKFDPASNAEDACRHHPGAPFFHDAYKGWTCCNKKCTDFTEFLNIKGCALSAHTNIKPPEPVKPEVDKELEKEATRRPAPAPIAPSELTRPPFHSPLVALQPTIADALHQAATNSTVRTTVDTESGEVTIGTSCKNGGCSASYEGAHSDVATCTYHPGCPIFHEGLKFWSCCQKRTTDFNTFLSQPGCTIGVHKWKKETQAHGTVKCRWDWHQTPEHVIVSVYAKQYHPTRSYVKLNPIRLNTKLVFPQDGDASFDLDLELRGMVNVERSSASMLASKLEVKLKKLEPGSWIKLDFPRTEPQQPRVESAPQPEPEPSVEDDIEDLSGVEAVHSIGKVNITEVID